MHLSLGAKLNWKDDTMLTPRENLLETINWGKPEYVPLSDDSLCIVGMPTMPLTDEPISEGIDPFGVAWLATKEGAIPDNTRPPMFTDISEWRKYVHFPDLSKIDFEGIAAAELANVDRENKALGYFAAVGCFERLVAFMGYMDALMALITDPDEVRAFFEVFTDYKIAVANRIIDAYHIDIYYHYDDIANARSLFMSPETYREVIKPYHAKLAKAVTDRGVIFAQHTCGCCEAVLEDFVDTGAKIWQSAQPMNDLPAILEKFRGRLVVEGGWDTSGKPSYIGATEDDIRAEVRRCLQEYGRNGGFILMPFLLNEKGTAMMYGDDRLPALVEEWKKTAPFDPTKGNK